MMKTATMFTSEHIIGDAGMEHGRRSICLISHTTDS